MTSITNTNGHESFPNVTISNRLNVVGGLFCENGRPCTFTKIDTATGATAISTQNVLDGVLMIGTSSSVAATLPSCATLYAALHSQTAFIGATTYFTVYNAATTAVNVTVTNGGDTNWSLNPVGALGVTQNLVIGQHQYMKFKVILTNLNTPAFALLIDATNANWA